MKFRLLPHNGPGPRTIRVQIPDLVLDPWSMGLYDRGPGNSPDDREQFPQAGRSPLGGAVPGHFLGADSLSEAVQSCNSFLLRLQIRPCLLSSHITHSSKLPKSGRLQKEGREAPVPG